MNKILLSAAIIASLGIAAIAPQTARAADGTITFTGKVVANTCVFSVGGGGASNTVALPVVFTTALATPGATAGTTNFSIGVTGCDTNLASVQAFFSGANIDASTGNLTNTGTATNVEVQLLNGGTAMPLNAGTASGQNSPVGTLSGGATTLNYAARYIAVGGAATSGLVNTSVAYTMTYQ